jgi:ESS family glutamate:Na+ symporter
MILAGVAILWNVFAFVFFARVIIPYFWFERDIGDLGQAMGMTATGLLLMKIADPDNQSMAFESFGYKQLLFEPFVGGGLFIALSLPLIHTFGSGTIFIVTAILTFSFFAIEVRVAYRRM